MITLERLNEIGRIAENDRGGIFPDPAFPPSVYYRFFRHLAAEIKPRIMVELGVCGGGGALHMAIGNPKGVVIGVDFQDDHHENIEWIKDHYENFHFWVMDSMEAAKKIFDAYGPIDFLFIDTDHTLEHTLAEYNAYKPFLAKDAIVCFDDLFRPGMEDAWNLIPEPKTRMDYLHDGTYPHGGGFGVHINQAESPTAAYPGYEMGC